MSAAGQAVFWVCGTLAVVSALGTVLSRVPLRAALSLLAHIIALAALYLTLHAQLLGALQLLVYAGAVVVLFVFVIMMIGSAQPSVDAALTRPRSAPVRAMGAGFVLLATAAVLAAVASVEQAPGSIATGSIAGCDPTTLAGCLQFGGVEALGRVLYQEALVPFEVVSILLLVSVVGAVAVARGRTAQEAKALRAARLEADAAQAATTEQERKLAAEVAAHGGH